jgi:hypothetical protein
MPDLREKLMGIAEYHSSEWAARLNEVGGPGVGGTELAYHPHFVQQADTEDEYIRMALETSIPQTWEEATWCYVYGQFRACILLCATVLELAIKYELFRRDQSTSSTLGPIIDKCGKMRVLSESLVAKAKSVNIRRNDVIHANIQTDRPESLLYHTGEEHEIEPIEDLSRNITSDGGFTGDGETISIFFTEGRVSYSRVHAFKKAARASLLDVREILGFLYPVERDSQESR